MPKFYPHDVAQARARSATRMALAKRTREEKGGRLLGEHNLLHLEEIVEIGLPDCYASFEDFLNDFYPDFSWDNPGHIKDINYVFDQGERFEKVATAIKEVWGYDIKAELQAALLDAQVN